jgi:hypothetical protein
MKNVVAFTLSCLFIGGCHRASGHDESEKFVVTQAALANSQLIASINRDEFANNVKRARHEAATKGRKSQRDYVRAFDAALRPSIEMRLDVEIPSLPIDESPLADKLYVNYVAMIGRNDNTATFIGDPVEGKKHVETVSISPGGEQCTAIIIARNAVATASHCAGKNPKVIHLGETADSLAQTSINPADFEVVPMPKGLDMAILVRKEPFGLRDEQLPVFASDKMISKAQELQLVGYGGANNDSSDSGIRRVGVIPMLSSDCKGNGEAKEYDCHPGFEIIAGARAMFDRRSCPKPSAPISQHGACHGDSGGPVYVDDGGSLFLAGLVRAIVDPKNCGCAHATNVYVRFDTQEVFLKGLKTKADVRIDFPPNAFSKVDGAP